MSEQSQQPVLRRKVGAQSAAPGTAEMTPEKAMRLALAKAGDTALRVPVSLTAFEQKVMTPEQVDGGLPDPALILQMDDGVGGLGLAVLCPQAVAAAIEAQTLGKVLSGAAGDRKPTGTDASLVRDFIDAILHGFDAMAEATEGVVHLGPFKAAARLPDARAAGMTLEDLAHRQIVVEMNFSGGAKSGTLHLILPPGSARKSTKSGGDTGLGEALSKVIMGAKTSLEAQVHRFKLPLAAIAGFEVGQVVPLEGASIDRLILRGLDGRRVSGARLGRSGNSRAVRVQLTEDARVTPKAAALPVALGAAPARLDPASMAIDEPDVQLAEPVAFDPAPMADAPAPLEDLPAPMNDLPAPMNDLPAPLDDLPAPMEAQPLSLDLDD